MSKESPCPQGLEEPPSAAIQCIRQTLLEHRDESYRTFQCSLIPTVDPETVLGVRTPVLRRMAKELRGTPYADTFIATLPHRYFEENQLHAFLIESIRDFDAAVCTVDIFLPHIDNWATCDQLSPKIFKGHFDTLLPHVRRWIKHPTPYVCRFGLGMLMRYGLTEHFDPDCLSLAADPTVTNRTDYYVRMMVAWFFATALAYQYETVLPYLTEHCLPLWIHNKTIQKACESYRVSDAHKIQLRRQRKNQRMQREKMQEEL